MGIRRTPYMGMGDTPCMGIAGIPYMGYKRGYLRGWICIQGIPKIYWPFNRGDTTALRALHCFYMLIFGIG